MPLTDAQKKQIKEMPDEERAELLEALGMKSNVSDPDLLKTVESLQEKVGKLEKSLTRKGTEERRKSGKESSWFDRIFSGA